MNSHDFECLLTDEDEFSWDLHTSASIGCEERVRDIIENGSKRALNATNISGWTALMYAACCGNLKILALLLEEGAKPDLKNPLGHTALVLASRCGSTDAVAILLNYKANVNEYDAKGWSALSHASVFGHRSVVQLLIEKGAIVDFRAKTNELTPLMMAAAAGHEMIVRNFLQLGSNPLALTKSGETAGTLAAKNGHLKVKSLLDVHILAKSSQCPDPSPCSNLKTLFKDLQLTKYYDVFESQGIDLNTFWLLTDEDLMQIGIQLLGPRKKMSVAIARWHKSQLMQGSPLDLAFENKLILENQKLQQVLEQQKAALCNEFKSREAAEHKLNKGIETLKNFADSVQKNMSLNLILQEKLKKGHMYLREVLLKGPKSGNVPYKFDIILPLMNDMDKLLDEINHHTFNASQQTHF